MKRVRVKVRREKEPRVKVRTPRVVVWYPERIPWIGELTDKERKEAARLHRLGRSDSYIRGWLKVGRR